MNVIVLTVFVSLSLVFIAVLFFAWSVERGEYQHIDRVTLLPLEDDKVCQPTEQRRDSVLVDFVSEESDL